MVTNMTVISIMKIGLVLAIVIGRTIILKLLQSAVKKTSA